MQQKNKITNAIAIIHGSDSYPDLHGRVLFYQHKNCVLVKAEIQGLPSTNTGFFGFHVHTGNNCTGVNFADTGSHYNPTVTPHPSHAGDLPPLMYCNSNAYLAVTTSRFRVEEIIGRTVVIHSMADDFHTQPAGNAGTKIACGVIKRCICKI